MDTQYFVLWSWLGVPWTVHGPFISEDAAFDAAKTEPKGANYTFQVIPGRELK